ncbi:MAG: hypothetical protein LBT25_08310 [Candidatus Symbiothrix sp.]|nr:hypothetical protein [Candidatus Symbiothrix sp.]
MKKKEIILVASNEAGYHMLDPMFQNKFDEYFYLENEIIFLKETQDKYSGIIKVIYSNGKTCSIWNYEYGMQNGEQILFYENGEKLSLFNVVNNLGEGKQYNFYENGKLKRMYTMKKGKKAGNCINYYRNGEKESEGYMFADEPSNEIKKSHWIYYYENGKKKEEGEWGPGGRHGDGNVPIGIWKYYDERGKLIKSIEYDSLGRVKNAN